MKLIGNYRRIWQGGVLASELPKLLTIAALSAAVAVAAIARMTLAADAFVVVVATALFGCAALATLAAWMLRRRAGARLNWLDLAGIFTCIGIAASILIDPEEAAQFIAGAPRTK